MKNKKTSNKHPEAQKINRFIEIIDQSIVGLNHISKQLNSATDNYKNTPEYWQAHSAFLVSLMRLETVLNDFDSNRIRQLNKANASKPRKKRGKSPVNKLRMKGLQSVLRDQPSIESTQLISQLEVEPLTFDDDDIEVRLESELIVIRDLKTGSTSIATIEKKSLRKYLSDARNS